MNIWEIIFIQPLLNGIILFYKLTGNLGMAIILFTVLIRTVLIPLTLPSLKMSQKMKELAPYLERLKLRYKDDKKKLAEAQMELYRQHGVNPVSGCLPQILQIVILFALYQVFLQVLSTDGSLIPKINKFLWSPLHLASDVVFSTKFLYLDLVKPDVFHLPNMSIPIPGIFLVFAAIVQFVSFKMMMPVVKKEEKIAKASAGKTDDLAVSMQQSMLWTFPLMTLVFGFAFPSGLVLYWFVYSLFQAVQQYFISGWGGLKLKWKIKLPN